MLPLRIASMNLQQRMLRQSPVEPSIPLGQEPFGERHGFAQTPAPWFARADPFADIIGAEAVACSAP